MSYEFYDKLVLRTPLKPLKTVFSESELKELFQTKEANEALFLASPDLHKEYGRWVSGELTDTVKLNKMVNSLLKYASRMHSRCTPFGLFAKCTVVNWGDEHKVKIDQSQLFRSTRLDMHFSCQLAQKLAQFDYVNAHLLFYPNTSIYSIDDKIRYVEYNYVNKRRDYQISAVDQSIYVKHIVDLAMSGATIDALANALVAFDNELEFEESRDFVEQLIAAQLLVSEIEPSVSGDELMDQIYAVLKRIEKESDSEELKNMIAFINEIQSDIKAIDSAVFNDVSVYLKLEEKLKKLEIPYELSKLFQTDLFSHDESPQTIDRNTRPKLRKAFNILNKLSPLRPRKDNMSVFREKFQERYEDREVSLLTVMDNEAGIGYAGNTNHTGGHSPLVNDLAVGGRSRSDEVEMKWNGIHSRMLRKLIESKKEGTNTVEITDKDLEGLDAKWTDLPDTFSAMFSFAGEKIVLGSVGGVSAANLLGRFASGHEGINGIIQQIEKVENQLNENKILAEIVHLPEARTGNILMRPSFREYEIPYLSKSNLPAEQQLELSDLYLSVKRDRFVLRSKKLGKEVIPRMANAHNYSHRSLPVYHFLCDLQSGQKRGGLYFSWGSVQNEFDFLPRVEAGGVVLSVATWNMSSTNFKPLLDKEGDLKEKLKTWKDKWELPDLLVLADGDNELLINLTDELSVRCFLGMIKKRPSIVLKEFLHDSKDGVITGADGSGLSNQLIAVLMNTKAPVEPQLAPKSELKVTRDFALGSEWIYYKLYCGTKTADEILTDIIKPCADNWIETGVIDKWFFIRYGDPNPHVRVRFRVKSPESIGTVVSQFGAALNGCLENGLIWKIQADTYQRELERYGASTMEIAETIFYHDSKNCVDVLSMLESDNEGEKIRWLYALRAIDEYFNNFGFDLEQKRVIVENLRTGFGSEFGMNKHLNKQLDKKFRADKGAIEAVLNREKDAESEMLSILKLSDETSLKIKPLVAKLHEASDAGKLGIPMDYLLGSYTHMFLNRFFKNKQRLHELVVYDFLWRIYRSQIARQKNMKK